MSEEETQHPKPGDFPAEVISEALEQLDREKRERTTRKIEFSEEAYEALEKLAQERGVSITEVLRDALSHEQWIDELRKDNARVLVERNGERRELVLDYTQLRRRERDG